MRNIVGREEEVRRLFDRKAARWAEKYRLQGPLSGRIEIFREALRQTVGEEGYVLDFGCGSGDLANGLSSAGYGICGVDFSEAMISSACRAYSSSLLKWTLLEPGWKHLPFHTGTFDGAIASSVLEYVPNPLPVLMELERVLKSSGVLLCTVPNVGHPSRYMEQMMAPAARRLAGRWPLSRSTRLAEFATYLSVSERRGKRIWRRLARDAGFRVTPYEQQFGPLVMLVMTKVR